MFHIMTELWKFAGEYKRLIGENYEHVSTIIDDCEGITN